MANPSLNKGSAFSDDERHSLGLEGLLPDAVQSIEQQMVRMKAEFDRLHSDLERHILSLIHISEPTRPY